MHNELPEPVPFIGIDNSIAQPSCANNPDVTALRSSRETARDNPNCQASASESETDRGVRIVVVKRYRLPSLIASVSSSNEAVPFKLLDGVAR